MENTLEQFHAEIAEASEQAIRDVFVNWYHQLTDFVLIDMEPGDVFKLLDDCDVYCGIDASRLREYLQARCEEIEIIYYSQAIQYLQNEDDSLLESLGLARELGYTIDKLNSELLATLHVQNFAMQEIDNFVSDIVDAVHEAVMKLSEEPGTPETGTPETGTPETDGDTGDRDTGDRDAGTGTPEPGTPE